MPGRGLAGRSFSVLLGYVIVLALMVTACATYYEWTKPGMTELDGHRDSYECQKDARAPTSGGWATPYGGSYSSDVEVDLNLYVACMQSRGYTLGRVQHTKPKENTVLSRQTPSPVSERVAAPVLPVRRAANARCI